jgi:hypothetical protein
MGCYQGKNNEGKPEYSKINWEDILDCINTDEAFKILEHYNKGFRFHHMHQTSDSCNSFLSIALKKQSFKCLRRNNLTVADSTLEETVEGKKTVFSYILSDETLLRSLIDCYGHEYVCHLDFEKNKKAIEEFLHYEKGNTNELWKQARYVFNIRCVKLPD